MAIHSIDLINIMLSTPISSKSESINEFQSNLEKGANPNYIESINGSTLIRSLEFTFLDYTKLLLSNGADPNQCDTIHMEMDKLTTKNIMYIPIAYSLMMGFDKFKLLIDNGADLSNDFIFEHTLYVLFSFSDYRAIDFFLNNYKTRCCKSKIVERMSGDSSVLSLLELQNYEHENFNKRQKSEIIQRLKELCNY